MQRTGELLDLGEYSPNTKRHYLQELRFLFTHYCDIRPSQISYADTLNYLIYLNKTLGCSRVKSKMAANSFAFFFRQVCNKPYKVPAILFAAHSSKLPAVMKVQEVYAVINALDNTKHKTLITLLYSTGMRLSEIANLKIEDIDSTLMRIKVVSGNIMQNTLAKIGLENKNYSVHTIRHSFATHLIDNGADLQLIQQLLGHHHISQTTQYLHLSSKRIHQTVNPYDAMMHQINNPTPKNTQP